MRNIFIIITLVWIPGTTAATEVPVHQITEGNRIEQLLNQAESRATAEFEGAGTTMKLTYSSPAPLHVLVLFTDADGNFNPLHALVSTLPAGVKHTAELKLGRSPAWQPGMQTYRLHFLGTTGEGAGFQDIEFTGAGIVDSLWLGLKQLLSPLPFTPSSYHRSATYTAWNMPIIPIAGILLLVTMIVMSKFFNLKTALFSAVLLLLIVQFRYASDNLYYAVTHATDWFGSGTYATAGALPEVGLRLRELDANGVYLCTTGTSYAERVLAYHAYPVPLSKETPSHIVVHKSADWEYASGRLRCGDDMFRAQKLHTFADGSALYSVSSL